MDGEVRRRWKEREVVLDDGVVEGEGGGRGGGGGGEGRRQEERSTEGDTMRGEDVRETRPLLWVVMIKISLLPSLPVLLFFLFLPHPHLLPLLLPLLCPFPLRLFLFLLLSLPLNTPLLLPLLPVYTRRRLRCQRLNNISTVIAISDMITVRMTTVTSVNIITAVSDILITTPDFVLSVVPDFRCICVARVITLVCITGVALSCSVATNICCFVNIVASISGNLSALCLLVFTLTVVSVCIICDTVF